MNILSSIFGGGGAGSIVKAVGDVADNLFTSDEEKQAGEVALLKAQTEARKVDQQIAMGQIGVNRAEAMHRSMFVAGWRPFVGWICGIAMVYHFLIFPLAGKSIEKFTGFPLVDLAWNELSVVLLGMLGIGGLRTWEKVKGVARNNMKG